MKMQHACLLAALTTWLGCEPPMPLTSAGLQGRRATTPPPTDAGNDPDITAAPAPDATDATIDVPPTPPDLPVPPPDASNGTPQCLDATPLPAPGGCGAHANNGLLSGFIRDECDTTGVNLIAQIGLDGQHGCSFNTKGSFQFRNLTVGCPLTLTVAKPGYHPYCANVAIPPGSAVSGLIITLKRIGGCAATPAEVACMCDASCVAL